MKPVGKKAIRYASAKRRVKSNTLPINLTPKAKNIVGWRGKVIFKG